MTRTSKLLCLMACGLAVSGCFRTKTVFPGTNWGPEKSKRQWFTAAGLIDLSKPAVVNCPNGLAVVESEIGVVDGLISIGLSVGGMILANATACGEGADPRSCASAVSAGTSLPPLLLGSRTVRYRCNE
jgi:hypothetical protein